MLCLPALTPVANDAHAVGDSGECVVSRCRIVPCLASFCRFGSLPSSIHFLTTIVVGAPARLDGSPSKQTAKVDAFVAALRARTKLPIVREDERLTSREAESRLAVGERDWRRRKMKLDAAAAAIILQDYLDRQ